MTPLKAPMIKDILKVCQLRRLVYSEKNVVQKSHGVELVLNFVRCGGSDD